ncbi:MAG: beta-galactosidase [Tepidisphaeraceae bacterium]
MAEQLRGTLWKEGGPVIGVQIENEYGGAAEHLLTLRDIAIECGLDVPYYTRTGWPELQTPMEFGKLLPLYGGYAEGFWDRVLTSMPGPYWKEFVFKTVRTDAAIANEQFGTREARDEPGTDRYPYLTCELGAGMMCSYHRRISVFPQDPLSMCVTKLGSGSNLPGYYMYHGGTNPAGAGTLAQRTPGHALHELQRSARQNLRLPDRHRRVRPTATAIPSAAADSPVPARLRRPPGVAGDDPAGTERHENRQPDAALRRPHRRPPRLRLRQQLPTPPADARKRRRAIPTETRRRGSDHSQRADNDRRRSQLRLAVQF